MSLIVEIVVRWVRIPWAVADFPEEHAGRVYWLQRQVNKDGGYEAQVKDKAIPVTGREGPYGSETLRFPHFLQTVGSQMAVMLSDLSACRPLPPGKFLVLICVRG
jgi:hypothetical protein